MSEKPSTLKERCTWEDGDVEHVKNEALTEEDKALLERMREKPPELSPRKQKILDAINKITNK